MNTKALANAELAVTSQEEERQKRISELAANPAAILSLIADLESAQDERRALLATEQNLRERVKALEEAESLLSEALSMIGSELAKDTFGYEWHNAARALLEKTT